MPAALMSLLLQDLPTAVSTVFGGTLNELRRCGACGWTKTTLAYFLHLQLPIHDVETLPDALGRHDEALGFRCERCKKCVADSQGPVRFAY